MIVADYFSLITDRKRYIKHLNNEIHIDFYMRKFRLKNILSDFEFESYIRNAYVNKIKLENEFSLKALECKYFNEIYFNILVQVLDDQNEKNLKNLFKKSKNLEMKILTH